LLRNRSSRLGLGFFEAHNFFPDFMLWLLHDGRQHIASLIQKGLRNLQGSEDPKIQFYALSRTPKPAFQAETLLFDIHSFIVSNTPLAQVTWRGPWELGDLRRGHVFFQPDDRVSYISKVLRVVACNEIGPSNIAQILVCREARYASGYLFAAFSPNLGNLVPGTPYHLPSRGFSSQSPAAGRRPDLGRQWPQ